MADIDQTQQEVVTNEKHSYDKDGGAVAEHTSESDFKDDEDHAEGVLDPFVPLDGLPEENRRIVTIRAVFIGICCGVLVNASNIYLGLKTGWTFSANLFGALVGFAIIKTCSTTFAAGFPILGGDFGPRENNIVQTAATAAGGMSNVFVSAIPALYQLKLMDTPENDFWRIVALTAVGGYFGFFFGSPLRKFFIIYVARELRLVFPTPSATAVTIRSMHEAATGAEVAKKKIKALGLAFIGALVLRVVSQYALGILWDWHIFTWFYLWGGKKTQGLMTAESWGWGWVEWTPAFIGSGMLVGLNVSWSFYIGSILAWGIIGPALIATGAAVGLDASTDGWPHYPYYFDMSDASANKQTPSPRYWLVWPGVLLMIAVSFTELFLQYKVLWIAAKALARGVGKAVAAAQRAAGKPNASLEEKCAQSDEDVVEDTARPEDLVPMYLWLPGLVISVICICVVLGVKFDMPVGESLLAVFLAFFFSFLTIQCAGVTDITPLTAASKASQIVLGGVTKGNGMPVKEAQTLNLLGGAMANIGANQAGDLVGDFRVGFLLRTPPIQQWYAQGLGTIVAVFIAPAMFVLFAKAYPCVTNANMGQDCPFQAPSVVAWRAVAVAVTDPTFPIPNSSGIFSIVLAIIGAVLTVVRHYVWVGRLEWMRNWHPNMMVIGLAFTLPASYYGVAMLIGSYMSYFLARKSPATFELYGYPIAAGLIAGEGIGGVINAIFQVAGISGDKYGSMVACPLDSC